MIESVVFDWYSAKTFIERSIAFSDDALHVFAGFVLQLAAAWSMRCSVARAKPWLVVLALELANEASDLFFERWPQVWMQLGEGAKDILLTMAVPTLLVVVARKLPRLLADAERSG